MFINGFEFIVGAVAGLLALIFLFYTLINIFVTFRDWLVKNNSWSE